LRALVTTLVLTASSAAPAETFHSSLSGGAGLAYGLAGLKFELRYGPAAAFFGLGLGWGSTRPAAGIRYYFADGPTGAGFLSLEYARYNESWYDTSCCEYRDDTYHGLGAVLGYRFRFAHGFLEAGVGPAWTLLHSRGEGPFAGPHDTKQVSFGLMGTNGVPDFDLALGFEF
jgi:hypothetical protein